MRCARGSRQLRRQAIYFRRCQRHQKNTDENVVRRINENMFEYLGNAGIEKPETIVSKALPKYLKDKAGKTLYQ
jgi:hypothetical protein